MTAVQKRDTDVSKVFLTYMTLQGDARRTAHAMGIDVELVRDLAVQEQWDAKLSQYTALKEQDADIQIQINRSLSYVQARQLSMIADNMIKEFSDPERMMALMTTSTKNGSSFSTKPLTDLVRAVESIQGMAARALGDAGTKLVDEKVSGAAISLNVSRMLNECANNVGIDAVTIVQKNLEKLPHADASRNSDPTPAGTP